MVGIPVNGVSPVGDQRRRDARPGSRAGVDDDTVEAVGQVSEALEYVERARGHLYSFHQLMGHADLLLGARATNCVPPGTVTPPTDSRSEMVGRNVLHGRWTFQIVEEFDDGYWTEIPRARASGPRRVAAGRRGTSSRRR